MTKEAVNLTQAQKDALHQHHIGFKALQIKALLIIEVLGLFSKCHESQASLSLATVPWFDIVRVTQYYKKQLMNRLDNLQMNSIIIDVNRAFILYACSRVNKCLALLQAGRNENVTRQLLEWVRVICYNSYYILTEADPHYLHALAALQLSLSRLHALDQVTSAKCQELVQLLVLRDKALIEAPY